ncbi:hypothetical protein ARAM_000156 [Aspergillus rambellii]|uniref:Alkaline phytoceramidase n=1 Tax=Aspergillus rambellii TaxID=308745 RepID=A0A0F8VC17_9EURO|nr:hypothetical protein ARAM_000156 [Aspergillus rambellii]
MRLIPFIPYPPAKDGFWEPVTSTLNWCEEDYYATKYAAEIINTLTNLLFMLLGVQGILSCRRHGHDSIFQIAYYGYLLNLLGAFLAGLAIFITLYYHYLQDPLFHQNAYALLTTVVVLRSMYTMEVTLRPSLRHTTEEDRLARQKQGLPVLSKEQQQYENARDLKNLNLMWFMVAYGLGMFLGGFGIWNLDNHFCTKIRGWRREVGLPWGIFLEGHGWWHLMTGIGAYLYIVWGIWLRHCLNKRQEEYHLWWPHIWNIPEVIRTSSTMNGSAKKSN